MKKAVNLLAALFITALAVSCGSTKEVDPLTILTGKTWELSKINGKNADASMYRELPYVSFSNDHKIMGKGGCNSFSGSYNLNDEGGLNVSQVMSTKMACEGVSENEFFAALEKANNTKIDPDKLVLMTGVDEIMVFVPKKVSE